MSFNSSTDTAFAASVSAGLLAAANPLSTCMPSSLNLSRNCIATYDWANATYLNVSDMTYYQQIANGLQAALPTNVDNVSLLDMNDYWSVLSAIPLAVATVRNAADACLAQSRLMFPNGALDFTGDCVTTATYFFGYINWNGTYLKEAPWQTVAAMIRASANSTFQTISDWTLYQAAIPLITSDDGVAALKAASYPCYVGYCHELDFPGNADIAGTGAMVVYWVVVALTTIGWLFSLYEQFGLGQKQGRVRLAALTAGFAFFDTAIYFALMTVIACYVYIAYNAISIYELVLCVFVATIATNANFVLASLYMCDTDDDPDIAGDKMLRGIVWAIVVGFQNLVPVSFLTRINGFNPLDNDQYVDKACYIEDTWPLTLARICSGAALAQSIWTTLVSLTFFLKLSRHVTSNKYGQRLLANTTWFGKKNWQYSNAMRLAEVCAFVFLWVNMIFLVFVRRHGEYLYGPSFGDNAMGFGQIIATGFCAQAIVLFFYKYADSRTSSTSTTAQSTSRPSLAHHQSATLVPLLSPPVQPADSAGPSCHSGSRNSQSFALTTSSSPPLPSNPATSHKRHPSLV